MSYFFYYFTTIISEPLVSDLCYAQLQVIKVSYCDSRNNSF